MYQCSFNEYFPITYVRKILRQNKEKAKRTKIEKDYIIKRYPNPLGPMTHKDVKIMY